MKKPKRPKNKHHARRKAKKAKIRNKVKRKHK
jgi:hypothetical protein